MNTATKNSRQIRRKPIDIFLDRMRDAGREPIKNGSGWKASCPAHDGEDLNLKISEGSDGTVVVTCHSRHCGAKDIASAIGLDIKDLFPPRLPEQVTTTGERRIDFKNPVAIYPYTDPDGSVRFQSRRLRVLDFDGNQIDKTFRQYRPDGKGGWTPGMGAVQPTLYRLPEILAADPSEPVYCVEGEKDVDRLHSLGLVATCNPMGAGKWRDAYSDLLAGRHCIVIPDNDEAGYGHARQVARSLNGKAASVRILEIPGLHRKGDVTDYLNSGGTLDRLNELASEAPEWRPTVDRQVEGDARAPRGEVIAAEHDGFDDDLVVDLWPKIKPEAFEGIAGEIAKAIEPMTEAHPVAILAHLTCGFGSVIGRGPYFQVNCTRHHLNTFWCMVGKTADGRKGTADDASRLFLDACDPEWSLECVTSGLSSGEGLIYHVRDSGQGDDGVTDKRRLVIETEFGRTLKAMGRDSNILSDVLRQAWDSGNLRTMTKNSPLRASNAHVSIAAHITEADLIRHLAHEDSLNGFSNRFLFLLVRRSKYLPDPPALSLADPTIAAWANYLRVAAVDAKRAGEIKFTAAAKQYWTDVYEDLETPRPGLIGGLLNRAAAQTRRLACLYALLDREVEVDVKHLQSAVALWSYCEASVRYIFRSKIGDTDAERVLAALKAASNGLTQSEISSQVFHRNKKASGIAEILTGLLSMGVIRRNEDKGGKGRSAVRWVYERRSRITKEVPSVS